VYQPREQPDAKALDGTPLGRQVNAAEAAALVDTPNAVS